MKHMTKIASLLLALVLVLSLGTTAFAASGTNSDTGTITIDNAIKDKTYSIYQIFVLESYNTEGNGAYAYTIANGWEDFINNGKDEDNKPIKGTYVTVTTAEDANNSAAGYVTWITDADVAKFAAAAKKYAETKSLEATKTAKATSSTVTFTGLNLGYYLIVSDMGAIASLDTTNPSVTIKEKNGTPTIDKQVQEDSNSAWGDSNDADIAQEVKFQTTINVIDGQPKGYILHDTMDEGLKFNGTVTITKNGQPMTTGWTLYSKGNETHGTIDGCTFEIRFEDSALAPNDVIVVSYSATVTSEAKIGLEGNKNKTNLSYKDTNDVEHATPEDVTITYVWDLDILKYGNGDESNVLKDAQFVLLNSDKSKVAKVENGKFAGWETVPAENEQWPTGTILTTDENGKIEIDGLDADTYYLREIKAPDGYNKLNEDIKIEVTGATKAEESDTLTYTTVVSKINNQSGTELPSTGGMGTTIFYVLGSVLAVGAVILLITKKRMGDIA